MTAADKPNLEESLGEVGWSWRTRAPHRRARHAQTWTEVHHTPAARWLLFVPNCGIQTKESFIYSDSVGELARGDVLASRRDAGWLQIFTLLLCFWVQNAALKTHRGSQESEGTFWTPAA